MILNVEQTVIEYLDKYGFLFESDSLILKEEIDLKNKIKKIKDYFNKKKKQLRDSRDEQLEKIKDFAQDISKDVASELNSDIEEQISKQKNKVRVIYLLRKKMLQRQEVSALKNIEKLKHSGLIISGISMASLLIYTSVKIYKNEKLKAEQLCKRSKNNKEKILCLQKYKLNLLKRRLDFLNNSVVRCDFSKEPLECKKKLDLEILKLREKIINKTTEIGRGTVGL